MGHDALRPSLNDEESLRVLRTLYRTRAATVAELQTFESMPKDGLGEILAALAADGLISVQDDRIDAHSPDRVIGALNATVLGRERERLAALVETTTALAALTRDWELGASDAASTTWIEIVHGHEAQWRAWSRYAQTHPPQRPLNLYPDLSVLRSIILPNMTDADRAALAGGVRAVLPASALTTDQDRATLELLSASGGHIRIVPTVPSWVYSDAGVLCALPLTWGEHPPSSIVIVQHPAIVQAVTLLTETYWERGIDYPFDDEGWQPVLALLARGMPDATIAETLGLSLRTVQRRITAAMDSHDVRSRFELGVAWSRGDAG